MQYLLIGLINLLVNLFDFLFYLSSSAGGEGNKFD